MNGAALLAVLAADPPIEVSPPKAAAPGELERRLGTAVADAAVAISLGLADLVDHGRFADDIKQMGGATLAAVAMLHLEHFGDDFDRVARREGRKVLEQRHGSMLREHLGPSKAMPPSTISSAMC
jgi:hypothetical protein